MSTSLVAEPENCRARGGGRAGRRRATRARADRRGGVRPVPASPRDGRGGRGSSLDVCRGLTTPPAPEHLEPVEHRMMGWPDGVAPMAGLAARGRRRPGSRRPSWRSSPLDRSTRVHADGRRRSRCSCHRARRTTAPPGHRRCLSRPTPPGVAGAPRHSRAGRRPGQARNTLLAVGREPYVAVLDGGDELLGDAAPADGGRCSAPTTVSMRRSAPRRTATRPWSTCWSPRRRRLRRRAYLTRGTSSGATTLEALGGFTEDPAHADLVDHHFWLSLVPPAVDGPRMVRRIGLALRPSTEPAAAAGRCSCRRDRRRSSAPGRDLAVAVPSRRAPRHRRGRLPRDRDQRLPGPGRRQVGSAGGTP